MNWVIHPAPPRPAFATAMYLKAHIMHKYANLILLNTTKMLTEGLKPLSAIPTLCSQPRMQVCVLTGICVLLAKWGHIYVWWQREHIKAGPRDFEGLREASGLIKRPRLEFDPRLSILIEGRNTNACVCLFHWTTSLSLPVPQASKKPSKTPQAKPPANQS